MDDKIGTFPIRGQSQRDSKLSNLINLQSPATSTKASRIIIKKQTGAGEGSKGEQENYLDDICIRSPIVKIRKKSRQSSRKAGEGITDDMAR
jgi:hypothetical protein